VTRSNNKRKNTIEIVSVTLNILVLLLIVGFYSFRMYKYYLKENGNKDSVSSLLVDELIKKQKYLDLTKGLVYDKEKEIYTFIGDVNDNYLIFSGSLYRIISIDSEYNIKAAMENSITQIYSGLENGFNDSYINKWLNVSDEDNSGIFENNLYGSELLFNTTICDDVIDDITNITCEDKNIDNKFGILSLYDYATSGGKSGYLNNGESFYLNTINSDGNNYYITSDGEVSINEINTRTYGIRSVITISGDVELLNGNGTIDSPYEIEKHDIETTSNLYVGNIISINDNEYIVNDISTESVKVSLIESLKDMEGNEIKKSFGNSNILSNTKNNIGYYLNNDVINELGIGNFVVKSDFYVGELSNNSLDYALVYKDKVSLNVGMLTLGDTYITDVKNIFTMYRGIEGDKIINIINEDGNIYGDFITNEYEIRPVFYIRKDLDILSGDGTIDDPFVIGVSHEEEWISG